MNPQADPRLSWLFLERQLPPGLLRFSGSSLVRNGLWFVAVVLFLGVWRGVATSHGFLADGEASLDWLHRTFVITTVYTCGSTLICNILR